MVELIKVLNTIPLERVGVYGFFAVVITFIIGYVLMEIVSSIRKK